MEQEIEIDTFNEFIVGAMASGNGITIFHPPMPGEVVETDRALKLAAYIVLLVHDDARFELIKKAIEQA